jgi:galactofuranose transport system substrate-binding protein
VRRARNPASASRSRPVATAAAAIAALALGLLASCSPSPRETEVKYLVGFSQANLTEPWRIAMTEDVKAEAARYSDMRFIYTDAGDSTTRQLEDVQRLLDYGVDLLIISPTDSHTLTPAVRGAYSKIPVIVLDRDVEGFDYSLFIGPDNERLGREAGNVVLELLGKRPGNVLEIQGRSGSPPAIGRSEGLREILSKRKDIKILEPIVADWLRDTAEDQLAERIRAIPKLDVIFAQNDAMAFGAWKAAQEAGRPGIHIIGIDGLPGATGGIELVRKGMLSATFTCPTGGKEAVIYARDLLRNTEGIPKKIYIRSRRVTAETLSQSLSSDSRIRDITVSINRKIVLGFAQVGSESEWRVANTRSIKAAAAKAGIELLFADGKQMQENQIAAIRDFIQMKVDIIAFSPVVESGWDEVLIEAKASGIPVILTDRSVDVKDDSLVLTCIGSDFLEEGRRAARWLVESMKATGPVNIVELQGTIGSAPAIDRTIGFDEVIMNYPNYRILASESGDFTRQQGYTVMRSMLARVGLPIDAVFAHNDDMAMGAIQALEEAHYKPGKDVIIVSVDAAHGAFKAMVEGKLNCSIECNPLLGPQLMKAVTDYMGGKDLPVRMITSEGVFPAETARRYIAAREY